MAKAKLDSRRDLCSRELVIIPVLMIWLEIFRSSSKDFFPSLKT